MVTAKKTASAKKRTAKPPAKTVPKVSPTRGKTPEWYLGTLPAWQQGVAQQIVAALGKAAPKASASIKWAQVVWEQAGPIAFMKGNKAHLTLGFWRGIDLVDPAGILEGDGDRMRHLKLRESEKLPAKEIAAFVKQAVALTAAKGDPTKC